MERNINPTGSYWADYWCRPALPDLLFILYIIIYSDTRTNRNVCTYGSAFSAKHCEYGGVRVSALRSGPAEMRRKYKGSQGGTFGINGAVSSVRPPRCHGQCMCQRGGLGVLNPHNPNCLVYWFF
ncbi:hypothetical protein XENTR_v10003385 [Xenopus tropicalis]|nr:hypothetical protein XENTR_v10003385 [Xenopus tropicalis]